MLTRAEAEDFLYQEAAILDEWRLRDWLALFTDDAQYWVPSTDRPAGTPDTTLFASQIALVRQIAGTRPVWAGIGAYRLSSSQTIENIQAARRLGAAAYVQKPVKIEGLVTSLQTVLTTRV